MTIQVQKENPNQKWLLSYKDENKNLVTVPCTGFVDEWQEQHKGVYLLNIKPVEA